MRLCILPMIVHALLTAYRANRVLSAAWLAICGYKLKIEGAENIDPTRTYMFVCNHSNMLDLPVTGYFLQHYYKTLVKKELKYVPIFGFLDQDQQYTGR
jgi:1-acyl-sn-glycerol-3-phosphate acyltransferase